MGYHLQQLERWFRSFHAQENAKVINGQIFKRHSDCKHNISLHKPLIKNYSNKYKCKAIAYNTFPR